METILNILKLWFYLSLVAVGSCAPAPTPTAAPFIGMRPATCDRYECPNYKLVEAGYAYEIRFYDSAVWISTDPIPAVSMVQATKTGLQRLFSYIQGNNNKKEKISEITSPTITQITPGKSVYTVSFYLPKKLQISPPQPTKNLTIHSWKPTYVAVRQIGGFISDDYVKEEVAALMDSLKDSDWIMPIQKSKGKSPEYILADYNSPSQLRARISEILIPFTL